MPKSLRTFLEDCRREIPNEVVHVTKEVDPAHYGVTAIIKHLEAMKKFPILIFDRPLNLHGKPSEFKLVMNCEISQRKAQIALGLPKIHFCPHSPLAQLTFFHSGSPPVLLNQKDAPV